MEYMRNLHILKTTVLMAALLLAGQTAPVHAAQKPVADVDRYDLIWDSPSGDASGSMPIGNGELAANVWVEQNGDLVFYMSRTDSWSETGELYKLGRIRVSFSPSITSSSDFSQVLDLGHGRVGLKGAGLDLSFWIDSEQPVIRIAGKSAQGVCVSAKAEVWRDSLRKIDPSDAGSLIRSMSGYPDSLDFYCYPDNILDCEDAVVVMHHNSCSSYGMTLDLQGIDLENRAAYDPFMDRCFGFRMEGKGFSRTSPLELESDGSVKDIDLRIATECGICHEDDEWSAKVTRISESAPSCGRSARRTRGFWRRFWRRSYIFVQTPDAVTGDRINQAYILQRWVQACAGRGEFPIKFNGSLFTVDPVFTDPSCDFNPDYRRWGGDYWWQNTRLPYYPMLKSGDFDMMQPLFEHYFRNLPMMKANARALCGVDGALSPETATVFGTFCCNDYGWDREGCESALPVNQYIKMHWSSSLEMISLMLDYYDYTSDRKFVEQRLVPYAREFLRFYNNAFGRDESGKLVISPTQSLETYWFDVVNDTPTVCGLNDVLPRLLALPDALGTAEDRALWESLASALPAVPQGTVDGVTVFNPAESFDPQRTNCENPELYPIFPYHLCNISTGNLQVGRESFWRRTEKANMGWSQDGQEAARLGLKDEAARMLLEKLDNAHDAFRFPAYWGPNYDWTPDQDHGSNLLTTLQEMVLQTYGGEDYLLPAFPDDWGVRLKLHGFGGKVVRYSRSIN